MRQHRHLVAASWTESRLRESAKRKLGEFSEGRLKLHRAGSYWALILDGNFEASLLSLDELWDEALASYAPTGAVVAVPCRDVLGFCDASDPAGIAELRRVIERVGSDRYRISTRLLHRSDGVWSPFTEES